MYMPKLFCITLLVASMCPLYGMQQSVSTSNNDGLFTRLQAGAYQPPALPAAVPSFEERVAEGGKVFWDYLVTGVKCYGNSMNIRRDAARPDAHSQRQAPVRPSVREFEEAFEHNRTEHTHIAIERFLGHAINREDTLKIGFAGSGGGCRAAIETIGGLVGFERLGMLDTFYAMVGVSGSGWPLKSWLASNLSVEQYKRAMMQKFNKTLVEHIQSMGEEDAHGIAVLLARKYYNGQHIGLSDIFGALLAQIFLKGFVQKPYQFCLSSLKERIATGECPLIISTAVSVPVNQIRPTIEISPLAAGSFELQAFCPQHALGRAFQNNQSVPPTTQNLYGAEFFVAKKALSFIFSNNVEPEVSSRPAEPGEVHYGHEIPLASLMGICGSAFAVDLSTAVLELYQRVAPANFIQDRQALAQVLGAIRSFLPNVVAALTQYVNISSDQQSELIRSFLAEDSHYGASFIPHFAHGNAPLPLLDAGMDVVNNRYLNIGVMPLLRRNCDVIVILDSSLDLRDAPSLRAAETRARQLGLRFPRVDYREINTRNVNLIVDDNDLLAPLIIYIAGIANPRYGNFDPAEEACTSTLNFHYPDEKYQALSGLIEHTVFEARDLFHRAYERALERKRRARQLRPEPLSQSWMWSLLTWLLHT